MKPAAANAGHSATASIILGLRALMETGVVLAFGYWGWATGGSTSTRLALAIGAPLIGFGFWGLVDFHGAGRAAEGLRLAQELAVSGLAATAVWMAGIPILGLVLVSLSLVYHAILYTSGGRLLKPTTRSGHAWRKSGWRPRG
jgi:hypothetical protein